MRVVMIRHEKKEYGLPLYFLFRQKWENVAGELFL